MLRHMHPTYLDDHAICAARVQRAVATLLAAGGFARRAARLPGKRAGRGARPAARGRVALAGVPCPKGVEGPPGEEPRYAAASTPRSRLKARRAAPDEARS